MTLTTSHKITDSLYLVRQQLPRSGPPPKPAVPPPTDHIVIVDCSGSMWGELEHVKKQLKNKLAALLGPKDTVSIIWFSGRGQCGLVIEAETVASLPDLKSVHDRIDKWLHPVGLTGFKEPIELALKTAKKLEARGGVRSLFFMSDGQDNQWARPEIMKVVGEVSAVCGSSVFVEYGFYADRALLAAMAEKAGGAHIHCADFPAYEPAFAAAMQKRPMGGKRIEVQIAGDPIGGFTWAAGDGDLLTFGVEFSKIAVPEATTEVCYLSPTSIGSSDMILCDAHTAGASFQPVLAAAYAAMSLFAVRMKPDIIYPILRALGDVAFIERFAACFGKQQYSDFMDSARGAAFKPEARLAKGWDPTKVPNDDAFTVLQLLQLLVEDDEARVLFDHPAWSYARIGRQRIDADDLLPPEVQTKVDELRAKLGAAKAVSKQKEIQTQIDALLAAVPAALKFTADPAPDGYPISNLTLNESRPNVSILVRKEGTVDLSARIAATTGIKNLDKLPAPFPTWIFRNYTIIKDGLVNVERLPCKMSTKTYNTLLQHGVDAVRGLDTGVVVINLKPLPTINRSMVKTASAKELFELEWKLTQLAAQQKVYNGMAKEIAGPKVSRGYGVVYGPEAAEWLKAQGLTDYNGFSPLVRQTPPSGDFYLAKMLDVSLKGFASLPSIKDVRTALGNTKGKALTGCKALMAHTLGEVDNYLAAHATAPAAVRTGWLEGLQKATTAERRGLLFKKAQAVFAIVVGQVWFTEFPTLDDKTLTLPLVGLGLGAQDVECTVELNEEQINL